MGVILAKERRHGVHSGCVRLASLKLDLNPIVDLWDFSPWGLRRSEFGQGGGEGDCGVGESRGSDEGVGEEDFL